MCLTAKCLFSSASALFSIIAALLWLFSSIVTVIAKKPKLGEFSDVPIAYNDGKKMIDVLRTAQHQSKWNCFAAIAAAIAAICQAIFLYL